MTIFNTNRNIELVIYGNLYINDEIKFEALKYTLPGWLSYWNSKCVLRIRGKYSRDVAIFCKNLNGVEIFIGSDLIQWRKQVMLDLSLIESDYVMLYLEDHMITTYRPPAQELLSEMYRHKVQIFQYSWYHQYEELRNLLGNAPTNQNCHGIYGEVNSKNYSDVLQTRFPWIVSMTSIFERRFLLKLLKSNRPFVRKFDPRSPYEIEQPPKSKWYLPIIYGLSKVEMGICLDDDNSILNSSAIARNLYHGNTSEIAQHHNSKYSVIRFLKHILNTRTGKNFTNLLPLNLRSWLRMPILWIGYLLYSVQTQFFCLLDYLYIKKISKSILKQRSNN